MFRWLALLLLFLAGGLLRAQERQATILLDDGRKLEGTVEGIDLGVLRLRVGDQVVTLATEHIRSCEFAPPARAVEPPPAPAAEAKPVPAAPTTATAPPAKKGNAPARSAPRAAPVDDADAAGDETHASRLRARLRVIDDHYPWLVPSVPTQWISVALLVFAVLSMMVHFSVRIAGAEAASFGRSMMLALWYEVTGFLQLALMPSVHFATFGMLVGNTTMAVFWLRNLFGLSRGGAAVALVVQLGFALFGYGLLEMVTSLLASVGMG